MSRLIKGDYNIAEVFTVDNSDIAIDKHAAAQIKMICDSEVMKDAIIKVMPDVHAGKIGPIGLTMKIPVTKDKIKILPGLIGNDIGCGISLYHLDIGKKKLTDSDFQKLDTVIREHIPSGNNVFRYGNPDMVDIDKDYCKDEFATPLDIKRVQNHFGTLGGGNHFIEIDINSKGEYYLAIHTGSRYIGEAMYKYFMDLGQNDLKEKGIEVPYEMTYLEKDHAMRYVADCYSAKNYASSNRNRIATIICKYMKWDSVFSADCPHNYIDNCYDDDNWDFMYLRKGATFAYSGMNTIVPINMRDGIILGSGKSNQDWNSSSPHGAGRIIKRSDVANTHTLAEYKKEMEGIYSPSINRHTLDEAPFVYRSIGDIEKVISPTLDIIDILHPVYNFKPNGGK